jgi:hypothetical protein
MLQPQGSILDMINGSGLIWTVSSSPLPIFGNLLIRKGQKYDGVSFSLSDAGNLGMLFAEAKRK